MQNNILDNIPLFKCRASQIGNIMTNGRGKEAGMGETAKNYLKEWVISQVTGNKKSIESKYLIKGIAQETKALERASNHYSVKFEKNNERKEDDYFTGEWDAINDNLVIDVKCPWDAFTFPYFDKEPPKGYAMQLQAYMSLTGATKASLVYCLENATMEELDRRAWQIAKDEARRNGEEVAEVEPDIRHWEQAESELNFDHLPDWLRIKVYEFDRDDVLIAQMQQRVIEAREVIKNEILPELEGLFNEYKNR